jgi:HNH endonuclease
MKAATIRRIFGKSKPRSNRELPRVARRGLTPGARAEIRKKTGGKCHFCGGPLGRPWQADHVVPVRRGGKSKASNYLPICAECNRLRWSYRPSVLRLALRVGLFVKEEIRHGTPLGELLVRLASGKTRRGVSRLSNAAVHDAREQAARERRRRTRG